MCSHGMQSWPFTCKQEVCPLPSFLGAPVTRKAGRKSGSAMLPCQRGSSLLGEPVDARRINSVVMQRTEQTSPKLSDIPIQTSVVRIVPVATSKSQLATNVVCQPSQVASGELGCKLLPESDIKTVQNHPSTPVAARQRFSWLKVSAGSQTSLGDEMTPMSLTATTATSPPTPDSSPVRSFSPKRVISKPCKNAPSTAQREARSRSLNQFARAASEASVGSPRLFRFDTAVPQMNSKEAATHKTSCGAPQSVNPCMSRQSKEQYEELAWRARVCFLKYDIACRGWLDFDQLVDCLDHLSELLKLGRFTVCEAKRILKCFDADRDLRLDCTEFGRLYHCLNLIGNHAHEPTTFDREMFISRREGCPIDHYTDLAPLGDGSFGVVRKVVCKFTGAERIIKTVDVHKAMQSGMTADMVMEEINRLKNLDHPSIIRLFEYYVEEAAFHLVTDLLPQGDLLEALIMTHTTGTFWNESWIADVFQQMCEGIAYAHAQGVMHKDIKLDNVMLCSVQPPQVVVIDFGLAENFPPNEASSFRSQIRAGCGGTMAPEVLMKNFSCKCDVWSLGCCLYGLFRRTPTAFRKPDGTLEVFPYPFVPPVRPPDHDGTSDGTLEHVQLQRKGADLEKCRGSQDCHDLIKLMLMYDDAKRPLMREVLKHQWFSCHFKHNVSFTKNQLRRLTNISKMSALEEAVLLDVSTKISIVQLHELSRLFAALDTIGDGQVEESVFASTLSKAGLESDVAEKAARKMACDGKIQFSRFVAALVPSAFIRDGLPGIFTRHGDENGCMGKEELSHFVRQGSVELKSMLEGIGDGCHIDLQDLTRHFECFTFEAENEVV